MRRETILVLTLVAIIVFPSVSLISAKSAADITSRRIICTDGDDRRVNILSKVVLNNWRYAQRFNSIL